MQMSFSDKLAVVLNKVRSSNNPVTILGSQLSCANPNAISYTAECLKGYIVAELSALGVFILKGSQNDIVNSVVQAEVDKAH